MTFPDIFSKEISEAVVTRIEHLTPSTQPLWGKMTVSQMLAHCCVTYEMVYDNIHPRPNALMRFVLKLFVKDAVTGIKPYKQNTPTAPAFKIVDPKEFLVEKTRLIDYIRRTADLGGESFEGKESHSFGALTTDEWNTMFYKHLDHHLRQFGV